ncbi:MAG: T9SS type A sorting domain-containing protein, partial [Bacteroidales bacterium]
MTLPATNISSEGFTANWTTHSLAEGYIFNLFKKEISESANVTILDQKMDAKPAGWVTGGYTDFNDKMAKLASGSNYGSLTTPELDLSKPGVLTVRAKRYGSDSGATISVKLDGEEIGVITTESELKDYTIELPESTKESQIEFYSKSGKRTYIDQVTITTGGTAEVYVPVAGYPVNLDLITAYTISGLEADTEYAYDVTTIADAPVKTSLSELRTLISTGIEAKPLSTIYGHGNNGMIYLYNLPENTIIQVFDLSGRLYLTKVSYSSNQQIRVDSKGVFLVRIFANNEKRMLKLIVK